MHELESQLTSLVITKATIQQLLELGVPFIRLQVKHWLHTHQQAQATDAESHPLLEDEHTPEEEASITQCSMAPYTSTIADYGEVVIAHGYFAMFGIAFPLAAVINLLNNLVESRTDVYKMLTTHQRPDADDAADIGGWLHVLHFVSNASLITTAALVTITTPALQRVLPNFIGDAAEKYPAVSFLIFEHMLLGIRWAVGWVVSDVPASAYRMLARQQFLTARCFGVGWKAYFKSNDEKEERGW